MKEAAHDVKHTALSVKTWRRQLMVVSRNVSLVFIDDMTADRSRRMNYEENSLVRFSKMLQKQSDSASKCKWFYKRKLQSNPSF